MVPGSIDDCICESSRGGLQSTREVIKELGLYIDRAWRWLKDVCELVKSGDHRMEAAYTHGVVQHGPLRFGIIVDVCSDPS